jgi:aspartyl-tRNA(Asn)/glutamyl-tRNA(Gln) amidotransferase subunit A
MLGTFALSAGYADQYYNQALKVRRLIRNDFDAAFQEVDVLLGPTSPTPAFRMGEKAADPLAMYLSDIDTITCNLAGIAGISVPGGMTRSGLPIGLQLLAPAFAEEGLFRAARVFERETDWHTRRPTLA